MSTQQTVQSQQKKENPMRKIRMEKLILSAGGTDKNLEKAQKLLEYISKKKAHKIASIKRIPTFGVRPGLEVGTRVTIRGKDIPELLKRLLKAIDNYLDKEQIAENNVSFGIKEYIEIPEAEYQREIGIRGFTVTVVFIRPGARVKRKKIKRGKLPKKQYVKPEEIISYMEENFSTEIE